MNGLPVNCVEQRCVVAVFHVDGTTLNIIRLLPLISIHSGHIYYSTCHDPIAAFGFVCLNLFHFKKHTDTMFNNHFIPLNVVPSDSDRFTVQALETDKSSCCAFGRELLRENHTSQNTPEELVEFAVRYLNEEKANHRPLPENIYIARINYFYPSFEAEVAQHMKDRWKPFVWRKFKFDLIGAIKLGLKCTFWPFALMPIYVRTLRGHAKLEDFFAYAFVVTIGLPYIFAPMWKALFS